MFSIDLEGHAPSWPYAQVLSDATERVPPIPQFRYGWRPRQVWTRAICLFTGTPFEPPKAAARRTSLARCRQT